MSHKVLDPLKAKLGKEITDSLALHPDFTSELAKVAEVSIKKGYTPYNYLDLESPVRVSTLLQASDRHIKLAKKGMDLNVEKTLDGEVIDIKVHHLVYGAFNLLMAAQIIKDLPEHDDRLFKNGKLKKDLGNSSTEKFDGHKYPDSVVCTFNQCACKEWEKK